MSSELTAGAATNLPAAAPTRLSDVVRVLLPVLTGFVLVRGYGPSIRALIEFQPQFTTAAVVGLAVVCAAFAFLRYPEGSEPARLLTVGLTIAASAYGLALGPYFAVADAGLADQVGSALVWGTALLIPTAALAIWRPSFAVFPFMFVVLHKELTRTVSGATHLGSSDYLPLVEVGFFLACGLCAIALLDTVRVDTRHRRETAYAATLLFAAAIGAHFGNYFMSGMAKVALDGGPLSWVLHNPTSSLMLGGGNLGTAPLMAFPAVFDAVHGAFAAIEIPVNVVTLAAQLLCALAFLHKRLLLGVTVVFDVMHVTIFALTGAMFLTWIVLNTLIVAALLRTPGSRFPPSVILVGMLVTILGHQVFWNARLGWYDGREVRHGYFTATDVEGGEHRVPSNFFRESSYLMLGRQFGYLEHARPSVHFPSSSWGQIGIHVTPPASANVTNFELMERARACTGPAGEPSLGDPKFPDHDAALAAAFIRGQHARALERQARGGIDRYDLYPHHHLSMPFLYRGFANTKPRDIVAYHYIVETVCLDSTPEGLTREVMARSVSLPITVAPTIASAGEGE
ncbi:hypothetical protein N9H93_01790 [Rhizobiaceae bacterium]|nr:hypothetical protein [Rhizobiaceae bacterium]